MKSNSRLSIAVHALILIYLTQEDVKVTGDAIAMSEQVNPVIIRGVLSRLKKAGILDIPPGKGGAHTRRAPEEVSLYDLYFAVNDKENTDLFSFHDCSRSRCPVAQNIHNVLDKHLADAQDAVRRSLSQVTMRDILDDMENNCGVGTERMLREFHQLQNAF